MPTGLFSCPPLVGDDPAGILRWVSSATVDPTHDGFMVGGSNGPSCSRADQVIVTPRAAAGSCLGFGTGSQPSGHDRRGTPGVPEDVERRCPGLVDQP